VADSVTTHGPVPLQPPPLHPVNTDPAFGVAVRVTTVSLTNSAAHVAPQLIPAGLLVTVPVPAPASTTVSTGTVSAGGSSEKEAVTAVAPVTVTVQDPVPLQPPPLHPTKTELTPGIAVSVTTVPLTKLALHVAPQSIPAGLLVTVPVPDPARVTLSGTIGMNVAVTGVAAVTVTVQVPVPLHPAPLHPVKTESTPGVAVSVTTVPLA
jgi:hypothetical protein